MKEKNWKPVIIVGAARSGTNMLRNTLTKIPDFGTWDCDEINPIWRHGNIMHPNDEFMPSNSSSKLKDFINNEFAKIAKKKNVRHVVEKTAANSLRVSFLYEIFPDAKYIFLFRNGLDVVPSAMKRWVVPIDWPYTFKKLKYTPKFDLLYYAYSYIVKRTFNRNKDNRMPVWGPCYIGMREDAKNLSLPEVCAKQWSKSVLKTIEQMKDIPAASKISIKYEDFVLNPEQELERILGFLGVEKSIIHSHNLTSGISSKSIGTRKKLSEEDLSIVRSISQKAMEKLEYS